MTKVANPTIFSASRVTLLGFVAIVASCLDSETITPERPVSSAGSGSSSAGSAGQSLAGSSASSGAGEVGGVAGNNDSGAAGQGGAGSGGSSGDGGKGDGGAGNGGNEQGGAGTAGAGGAENAGAAGAPLKVAFGPLTSYALDDGEVSNSLGGLTVGDFTGDGKPDVISSYSKVFGSGVYLTKKEGVFLFHGNGDGTFLSSPQPIDPNGRFAQGEWVVLGGHPFDVSSLDLDGDGFLDLLIADNGDDKVHLHRNDGKGVFSKTGEVQAPPGLVNLFTGDLDGDGKLEILALSVGSGFKASSEAGPKDKVLTAFCKDGASLKMCWQKVLLPESNETLGFAPRIALGDQDGNGKDEILASLMGGEVLLFRDVLSPGGGEVMKLKAPSKKPYTGTSASFGDWREGGADIVVSVGSRVQLLRAGVADFIGSENVYSLDHRILDMNGDGVGDLVTATPQYTGANTFSIFAGSKEGAFSHLLSLPGPSVTFTEHWKAVDLNGDKKLDLLAKEYVLRVFINESK